MAALITIAPGPVAAAGKPQPEPEPAPTTRTVGPLPRDRGFTSEHQSAGEHGGHDFTVGVTAPRSDNVALLGGCHFRRTDADLIVTAEATALPTVDRWRLPLWTAYGHPISVGVDCTLSDVAGKDVAVIADAAPGTTASGSVVATGVPGGSLTMCVQITAMYSDIVLVFTETVCRDYTA